MTVIFILELLNQNIMETFSFAPAFALQEPWTFVTAIFLHYDVEHIFFNMLALFMFGTLLESRIGSKKFLLIFFLSGILGNVGYMLTSLNSQIPALGASGAIYGIMGTAAVLMPLAIVYIGVPLPMIIAAFVWGITEFTGLFVPSDIAHGAHLLGLGVGILYGIFLRKTLQE